MITGKLRRSALAAFALLLTAGCAGQRIENAGRLADAGVAFADSVPAVIDESFVLAVTADSLTIAKARENLPQADRLETLKTMDSMAEVERALPAAMGPEEFGRLMKGAGDVFTSMEGSYFRISPQMSYVSKETEDADAAFWHWAMARTHAFGPSRYSDTARCRPRRRAAARRPGQGPAHPAQHCALQRR